MNARLLSSALALSMLVGFAHAAKAPPAETPDGLELVPKTKLNAVYRRPGATLEGYTEIGLVPCQVAFKQNWMKEHNRDAIDLSSRVTQKDVDRIRDKLGAECDKYFRAALLEDPPYTLVEQFNRGEPVLIVRPNIVNLDVTSPDLNQAGRSRSYNTSAGEMTLVLELLDGTTGEVLARAYDRRSDADYGRMTWSNGVTNKAAADRMLKDWAGRLRTALDQAIRHTSEK